MLGSSMEQNPLRLERGPKQDNSDSGHYVRQKSQAESASSGDNIDELGSDFKTETESKIIQELTLDNLITYLSSLESGKEEQLKALLTKANKPAQEKVMLKKLNPTDIDEEGKLLKKVLEKRNPPIKNKRKRPGLKLNLAAPSQSYQADTQSSLKLKEQEVFQDQSPVLLAVKKTKLPHLTMQDNLLKNYNLKKLGNGTASIVYEVSEKKEFSKALQISSITVKDFLLLDSETRSNRLTKARIKKSISMPDQLVNALISRSSGENNLKQVKELLVQYKQSLTTTLKLGFNSQTKTILRNSFNKMIAIMTSDKPDIVDALDSFKAQIETYNTGKRQGKKSDFYDQLVDHINNIKIQLTGQGDNSQIESKEESSNIESSRMFYQLKSKLKDFNKVVVKKLDKKVSKDKLVKELEALKLQQELSQQCNSLVKVVGLYYQEDVNASHSLDIIALLERGEGLESKKNYFRGQTQRCVTCMKSILEGLSLIHEKEKVHHDIKPANFLMVEGKVKLSDLGSVQDATKNSSDGGTQVFMPSQDVYNEQINKKTDIFSLGLSMFMLFKGVQKVADFQQTSGMEALLDSGFCDEEVLTRHIMDDSEMDAHFKQILLKCLDPNNINRPSCEDLMTMLMQLESD
ncbi:hypothetical protein DID75_03625 [Candidatus Marinamargulisbacteria bacterium SCGC AG-410-N11]|nr:hypothetical protein DID75_03625 [Candidatus Marinamargulisbacteria bacterium SCGC AG-410-N11]